MGSDLGVTSREWVIAFGAIVAIAVVALLGPSPRAAVAISIAVLLTLVASRACTHPKLTYFNGLRVVASINPTGETLLGQLFVVPALAVATLFSWFLGVTWLLGAREWPRRQWLAFLKRYQGLARRVSIRG